MDADLWKLVKEKLDLALKLAPAERGAFLEEHCSADDAMRKAVATLLDAHDQAQSFLEETPLGDSEPPLPDRIGSYRLGKKLGEGGMGEVYLAEQLEPVERKVALKLVRPAMASREVLHRFGMERQTLARMEHNNIARVYDAGGLPDGRTYFVMEYIEGRPITEHCDDHRLSTRQRLEILVQVCAAVQHAHQKGIIHRDIKPSNVIVKMEDGRPVPVVIDFGIAKATGDTPVEGHRQTEMGRVIGTPEYMSPEQAEGSPDIDTRTDVYSLGVLMYELLTGELPVDRDLARRGQYTQAEVHPPSQRTGESDHAAARARSRATDPRSLVRQLRGELDWITMKALATDPGRRYAGANDLAEDIGRYLAALPVLAGPPSASYRFRKLLRRHSVAASLVVLLTLTLLAGATGSAYGLVRAKRAEAEALQQAEISRATASFLSETLSSVDPESAGRHIGADLEKRLLKTLTDSGLASAEIDTQLESFEDSVRDLNLTDVARELLEREILGPAGQRIELQAAEDPVLAARLQQTLGVTYRQLGFYEAGIRHTVLALKLNEQELGTEHPETLTSKNNLATLYTDMGRYHEGESLHREVLDARMQVLGEGHPDTLTSVNNLAIVLVELRRADEAESLYLRALEGRMRVLGADAPDTLQTRNNLAGLYERQRQYAKAEPLYLETLEAKRRILGPDAPSTLATLHNLALVYDGAGRSTDAERLYNEALEGKRRVLGNEHPETIKTLTNLALLYDNQGRYDEAAAPLREILNFHRRRLGVEHRLTLSTMMNLASVYHGRGDYSEAEKLYTETLRLQRRVLTPADPDTLMTMANLAILYDQSQRPKQAEPLFREVLETQRRELGPESPDAVQSLSNLATFYFIHARYAEAEAAFQEALELLEKFMPDDRVFIAVNTFYLGDVLRAVDRTDEALALYERCHEIAEGLEDDHPFVPAFREAYAEFLRETGDDKGAAAVESGLLDAG